MCKPATEKSVRNVIVFNAARDQNFRDLVDDDVMDLLPLLYFTVEDIENLLIDKMKNFDKLRNCIDLVRLMDNLACVEIDVLWTETSGDFHKRRQLHPSSNLKIYACNDFELQESLDVKIKLIMQQLLHILNESPSEYCALKRCCSILESPTFIDEITSFLAAIVSCLSQQDLLPEIICGLALHSAHMSTNLIRRLILNFPHSWTAIWHRLLLASTMHSEDSSDSSRLSNEKTASKNKCKLSTRVNILAVLRFAITFTPQVDCILNYCVEQRCLPELVLHLSLMSHDAFCLLSFLKRIFFDEGRKTRNWFANYLKIVWDTVPGLLNDLNTKLLNAGLTISGDPKSPITKDKLISALEFLQVMAALRGLSDFRFSPDLRQFVVNMITKNAHVNERAVNFICYSLAFSIGLRSCLIDSTIENPFPEDATCVVGQVKEDQLVNWLRCLISRQDAFHAVLRGQSNSVATTSYSELLLLLALLFHTNQQTTIRGLISDVLGLDAPSFARNISNSRKLFTQKVFTEQMIANQAARVPVTIKLSAHHIGNLPIHCVHQLLKTHTFNKNRVQIKGWIYKQICESVRPMHTLLPSLVKAYVSSALSFASSSVHLGSNSSCAKGGSAMMSDGSLPFSEDELLHQFSPDLAGEAVCTCAPAGITSSFSSVNRSTDNPAGADLTPQLLFFYYMLYIYDQELTARVSDNQRQQQTQTVSLFSDRLWDAIPVTYLLQYARSHLAEYRQFYPHLLQLVTNHMPHLTVGELIIQDELLLDPFWQATYNSQPHNECQLTTTAIAADRSGLPSPRELEKAFDTLLSPSKSVSPEARLVSTRQVILCINRIAAGLESATASQSTAFSSSSSFPLLILLPFAETLATRMPCALLASASLSGNRRFAKTCRSLWCGLHAIMPQRLEVLTISSLTSPEQKPSTPINRRELLTDPVERIVMGVDPRVYRCPPVLHILLRILECNLLASRSFWVHRVVDRFFLAPLSTPNASSTITVPLTTFPTPNLQPIIKVPSDLKGYRKRKTSSSPSSAGNAAASGGGDKGDSGSSSRPDTPLAPGMGAPLATDEECDRLRTALVVTQDAAVVQLLLEFCLPSADEKMLKSDLTELREVRNIICIFIHYLFIAEPNLANVVFWQTYPRSIIPVAAQAIPSLHICMDSVFDVFRSSGNFESMVFCLDFVSHLALHYNIRPLLDRATYLIDAMHHIFTSVLNVEELPALSLACSAAFCRIGAAFPSLSPRIAAILLTSLSMMTSAAITTSSPVSKGSTASEKHDLVAFLSRQTIETEESEWDFMQDDEENMLPDLSGVGLADQYRLACANTMRAFNRLVLLSSVQRRLYLAPTNQEFV